MRFGRRRGEVIGDEPGNTIEDPDASEEAVPKSEGRTELPFLPALRQDVPGRSSGPCLRTGKVQSGRAGRGWTELSGYRIARVRGMAERRQGRTSRQDVSTTGRAAGHDPEARRRRTATRDSDDSGSGGANSRQAVAGTNLGSGLRSECLR